jgi:predicted O-methyltransferase YrrM
MLKSVLKALVNRTLLPLAYYLRDRLREHSAPVIEELDARAAKESADYAEAKMGDALAFASRERMWDFALSRVKQDGLAAEFGVWNGTSINYFARKLDRPVFGFDSFEGLQEQWGGVFAKGTFNRGGQLPRVRKEVTLVPGWFDKTLPDFLRTHPEEFLFVHIDCDTYKSAQTVLSLIGPRITSGTVIIFDEYFGYRGWKNGEFRAWRETVATLGITYEYLAFSKVAVAVRVR